MKIYRTSGKTWRDQKGNVTLYHASPDRLSRIGPRSSFDGNAGAFFSPTYSSIAGDWAPWVLMKKDRAHPLKKQWKDLWDRIGDLEDIPAKTPKEEAELESLEAKIEKLTDSFNNMEKQQKGYSQIYVHKVACPKAIFDKYQERIRQKQAEEMNDRNMGFWSWGDQVFIDQEDLSQLKVIKVEEWKKPKLFDEERNAWQSRYRSKTGWDESELSDPSKPVPQWKPEQV